MNKIQNLTNTTEKKISIQIIDDIKKNDNKIQNIQKRKLFNLRYKTLADFLEMNFSYKIYCHFLEELQVRLKFPL